MVLHELHVFQRHPSPVGHGHSVARLNRPVGRERVDAARATRAQNHGVRYKCANLPAAELNGYNSLAPSILHQQFRSVPLVVPLDRLELQGGLKQRVQQMEPDLVGGKPVALDLHPAKRPHGDTAVRLPAPRAPPVLELDQLVGSFATNASTTSWSASQSDPEIVSLICSSRLSFGLMTAAAPPSAETVWLRMG